MAESPIPLRARARVAWSANRRQEPVTIGVPFAKGALTSVDRLRLADGLGVTIPLQARALDAWADGSVRWALLDWRANVEEGAAAPAELHIDGAARTAPTDGIKVSRDGAAVAIDTGAGLFRFAPGDIFPVSGLPSLGAGRGAQLHVQIGDSSYAPVIADVLVEDAGPLRVSLSIRGEINAPALSRGLRLRARVELFHRSPAIRIAITIGNSRRAHHAGGRWPLGDPGSIFVQAAVLQVATGAVRSARCAFERGDEFADVALPFVIHQESSGGANWNGPAHRNRVGVVPWRFSGYEASFGADRRRGARASPILDVDAALGPITVAVPGFWEKFPSALSLDHEAIEVGLFPRQMPEPVELQGGERSTHTVVLACGLDTTTSPPLAWCHDPILAFPPADWICRTGAVPYLAPPSAGDPHAALVDAAIDDADGVVAKRERADEYGWRHFGDLVADHESALQPPDQPFVSHYNNQYDAIAGFATQFLRTGDARWWQFMDDLARHVRDVDIYHTTEDKAAYNGGLFWHTLHYADAGTSTHRCYPADRPAGGGPSSEHDYATGLMLHFFLTGDPASREAAIGLGRWVLAMDDGRLTPFRWLARGPTGLASATGSLDYQGPGRGAANSVLTCLAAGRLTGEPVFLAKAEELIRRVIHPRDDIAARRLFDVERRWFYTVMLQALGVFLDSKAERGELDDAFAYAQASLLAYAKWMAANEEPYLNHAERLEYPNETWVAQDMRKAEVFWWAAQHANAADRVTFLERASFFFDYSTSTLSTMPSRTLTRPVVLMLANGYRATWFGAQAELPLAIQPNAPSPAGAPPPSFEPQKIRAMKRARAIVVVSALIAAVALVMRLVWR